MPFFLHKEEKLIVEAIKKHVDLVVVTVETYISALAFYLDGEKEKSKEYTKRVHKVEEEAETSGDILTLVEPDVPEEIKPDLKKMGELTVTCVNKVRDGVYHLFGDIDLVFEDMKEVERLEGEVDKYVWKTLETVFKKLNIKKFSVRMMLREIILHLNFITNKMEDASDKIDIIALTLKS